MNELNHQLVLIQHHNIALLFANYLTAQNISAKLQENEQGFVVLCAQAQAEQAKQLFEEFIQNPHHPKYQSAAWQHSEVSDVRSSSPGLVDVFKANFIAHAGVITLSIFSLCWIVFIASYFGFAREIFSSFQFYRQLNLEELLSEPLRILTPAFFHFSLLHITFNTLWWWQLGGDIERQLGKGSLLHVLLLTAIVSNVGQFMVSGPNFGGLSGVVYGLFGYVWWLGWLKPEKGLGISNALVGFLLVWLMLGYLDVLPVNMANTAHLLGLLTGCLMALFKAKS